MFLKNLLTKYHTLKLVLRLTPNIRVFLRFAVGYLKVNLLGQNQLRFVEIFVTLDCNARCDFCSNGLFTKKECNISLEKYLNIIDECARLNVPVICLIGGEPLLYKHLDVLIKRINSHGIISMIATNGYLFTEERARELKKAGLTVVAISLHSLDEVEHDSILKLKGAYQRVFKVKEYCDKHGLRFLLASVVSHNDFVNGNFDRYIKFVEEKKIALSVNPLIPTGYAHYQKEKLLTYEDTRKLNQISQQSSYVSTHLTNNFFGFGCPAGNAYLGINATGEIFPCFFIPVSLGSVHQISLKQAWAKACRSPLFSKKHKMCYAGVSREFICKYLDPIFNFKEVPIPIEKHPLYDSRQQGLPDLAISDVKNAVEYLNNKRR